MDEEYRLKKLKELVDVYGTQSSLAGALDVSPGFISQILTGRRPLTEKTAAIFTEKLRLNQDFFKSQSVAEPNAIYEGLVHIGRVPVISWVRAGEFCEAQDHFHPGEAEEWMPKPSNSGDNTYALRVRGDSMTSPYPGNRSYPEGTIIYIDPAKEVLPGHRGIFRLPDSNEATFKELVADAGEQYLKPLNPQYDKIKVTPAMICCGRVIGSFMPE